MREAAVFGNALHVVVPMRAVPPFRGCARSRRNTGVAVTKVERSAPTLEDVFVSLIGRQRGCRRGRGHMRWHRLAAIARKEFIQIRRDPRSLLITVAMPSAALAGLRLRRAARREARPVYVFDREAARKARICSSAFKPREYFDVVKTVDNYRRDPGARRRPLPARARDPAGLLASGCATGGTVSVRRSSTPRDDNTRQSSHRLQRGRGPAVFSGRLQLEWLRRHGLPGAAAAALRSSRAPGTTKTSRAVTSSFPGVVALVMALIGALLTSLTIAREWERGTMEQLVSTPVTPLEIMFGKLVPYFVIGLFDAALCAGMASVVRRSVSRALDVFFLSSHSLSDRRLCHWGFSCRSIAKSQLAASQIALIATFLPAFCSPVSFFPSTKCRLSSN